MPLMDTLMGFATKYGPTILSATQQVLQQTPMGRSTGMQGFMPGSPAGFAPTQGFAAPRARAGFGAPRRKRRGLSASDIRGAQKVARLVSHFGYKPKIRARKRGR